MTQTQTASLVHARLKEVIRNLPNHGTHRLANATRIPRCEAQFASLHENCRRPTMHDTVAAGLGTGYGRETAIGMSAQVTSATVTTEAMDLSGWQDRRTTLVPPNGTIARNHGADVAQLVVALVVTRQLKKLLHLGTAGSPQRCRKKTSDNS